ncbi:Uncharacterised protein [Vibrio cholerae]|nr:Uncharacterised protein [Vibrio cholerae]CSB89476.1 Uncharacterised protein [Vibrio cholerae]
MIFVDSLTPYSSLMTRETVDLETPAKRATSCKLAITYPVGSKTGMDCRNQYSNQTNDRILTPF